MPKLLIRRQDKSKEPEIYFVANVTQDYHSKHGFITKSNLAKPDGSVVQTNTGVEFVLITASFADVWQRHRRIPQSMIAKDIGIIISTCGIGRETIVAEAGTGNGSLTAQLAHVCKSVLTFDVNEKHIENAKANIEKLGLTNVKFYHGDINLSCGINDVDVVILDVPEPWTTLDGVYGALKIGGWLVTYSPSTTQVHQTYLALNDNWLFVKTVEIIEREWKISDRIVRPDSVRIGHTAFLTFVRKIQ